MVDYLLQPQEYLHGGDETKARNNRIIKVFHNVSGHKPVPNLRFSATSDLGVKKCGFAELSNEEYVLE